MLASKIEDFPKVWPSKSRSKFYHFLYRFFIDFGSVLASNMGPSWGPRRLKIRKNGPPKVLRSHSLLALDTHCCGRSFKKLFASILGGSEPDFRRCLVDFSSFLVYFEHVFGWSFLTWFSLFYSVQTPTRNIIAQSFVLINSFPYRKPPYSKNVGRRYSPQGGFNPPPNRGRRARSFDPGLLVLPSPSPWTKFLTQRFWEPDSCLPPP